MTLKMEKSPYIPNATRKKHLKYAKDIYIPQNRSESAFGIGQAIYAVILPPLTQNYYS